MRFGDLKFTFGAFTSRYMNRYNVTASEGGLLDSNDIAKYGTALLNSNTKLLKDANNISAYRGDAYTAVIADYTVKNVLPGTLLLKAGVLTSGKKGVGSFNVSKETESYKYTLDKNGNITGIEANSESTTTQHAGYLFEIDYNQKDVINTQLLAKIAKNDKKNSYALDTFNTTTGEATFKSEANKEMVYGAYVQPLMLPFNLVIGFTYGVEEYYTNAFGESGKTLTMPRLNTATWGMVNKYYPATIGNVELKRSSSAKIDKITAMALDLRFDKKLTNALRLSIVGKWEYMDYGTIDSVYNYLGNKYTMYNKPDADMALTVAAEVSYIVNDLLTAGIGAGYYNADLDGNDDEKNVMTAANSLVRVRPMVVLTAGKNARITAAFQYDKYLDPKEGEMEYELSLIHI